MYDTFWRGISPLMLSQKPMHAAAFSSHLPSRYFFLTVRSSVLASAILLIRTLPLLQDTTTLCEATTHMTWKFNVEVDNKVACHHGALGKPLNIFTGQ
jgi:hypothetical protein